MPSATPGALIGSKFLWRIGGRNLVCGCRQSFTFRCVHPLPADRAFWFVVHREPLGRFLVCSDLTVRHYNFSMLPEEPQSSAITSQSGKCLISAQIGQVRQSDHTCTVLVYEKR